MKAFILLCVTLFVLLETSAQTRTVKHHKHHHQVQQRTVEGRQARMQMQLRQAQYHEAQVNRAEKVQKEVKKEQQEAH